MKLTARKHVCAPPCRNDVPTESHSDDQDAGYFPRTLWSVLLVLGSNEPPHFIATLRLLRGNSYLWCVCVVIYEKPTTDRIHRIRQVVEAPVPRWTFETNMREEAHEALAILRHEADERMAQSQYCHFPRRAEEGVEVVILPAGGHDRMGCFTDQVKWTCALVRHLDEAIKEVMLLGEHEVESSQKIVELEAQCKKPREDTQRLEEERVTLEEMAESHDELLMEITKEIGLDHMGEDEDEEEEE
jgi:hypothetical protein